MVMRAGVCMRLCPGQRVCPDQMTFQSRLSRHSFYFRLAPNFPPLLNKASPIISVCSIVNVQGCLVAAGKKRKRSGRGGGTWEVGV